MSDIVKENKQRRIKLIQETRKTRIYKVEKYNLNKIIRGYLMQLLKEKAKIKALSKTFIINICLVLVLNAIFEQYKVIPDFSL